MKKLFLIVASMVCASLMASDTTYTSVLYWQVDPNSLENDNSDRNYSDADSAKLYAVIGDNGLITVDTRSIQSIDEYDDEEPVWFASTLANSGVDDWSQATFFVELVADGKDIAESTLRISYEDLLKKNYIGIYGSGSAVPDPAFGGQVFDSFVIPEPTSGLMILMGLAGLALRRRKRV